MTASTGTQPGRYECQPPLPSAPLNPSNITLAKIKKLATFEPEAMNAALGVGAPSYASGAHKWKGTAATLNPKPITVITIARTSSGSSFGLWIAAAIWPRLVAPDSP